MADADADRFAYLNTPVVQVFDWIGFTCLTMTTFILAFKLFNFKPPERNCLYYFGYNEHGMASMYVNMFAATAYYAKICAHLSGNQNPGSSVTNYQYGDYMITCPLLTLDLLWTLNLPYKMTYSLMVFLTLFTGFMAADHPYPGRWMWFCYGMVIFSFTWLKIISLVQVRFLQYFSKKEKGVSEDHMTQSMKRVSMATKSGLRDKNVRNPLSTALGTYFCIWMVYPLLWLLREGDLITATIHHCSHVVMDVLAKSMYGFALLKFQLLVDKNQVRFSELKVTKAELVDDYTEQKKKIRKMQRAQDEGFSDESSDEDDEEDDEYDDGPQQQQMMGTMPGIDLSSSNLTPEQVNMLMSQQQMSPAGGMVSPKMYDENATMPGAGVNVQQLASMNQRAPSPRMTPRSSNDGAPAGVGGWRSQK